MDVCFKNFRCFKDTGMLTLKKITLLVGENNSGKTSFMAGLNHIGGLLNGEDTTLNTEPFELGSFDDICHFPSNKKKGSTFEYRCNVGGHLLYCIFENDHGSPSIKKYEIQKKNNDVSDQLIFDKSNVILILNLSVESFQILKNIGFNITLSEGAKYQIKFPFELDKLPSVFKQNSAMNLSQLLYYCFLYHMSENLRDIGTVKKLLEKLTQQEQSPDFEDAYELFLQIMHLLSDVSSFKNTIAIAPLRLKPQRIYSFSKSTSKGFDPYGGNLPAKLLGLSKSNEWKDFSKSLSEFGSRSGLFKKIDIERFKKDSDYPFSIMVETSNGQTSNLMDVGYGVPQILPLVFELMTKRHNHQYLIQQPEVHLHPKAQAEFASFIAMQCSGKKKQKIDNDFVIETHSDHMLDRFKYEIKQGTISHEDIGILFFEPSKDGKRIHQINLSEDGSPNNAPPSYRRFFLEEMERNWK